MPRILVWFGVVAGLLLIGIPACDRLATTGVTYLQHPVTGEFATVVTSSTAVTTSVHWILAGRRNALSARLRVGEAPYLYAEDDCLAIGNDGPLWVIEGAGMQRLRPSDAAFPYRVFRSNPSMGWVMRRVIWTWC